MNITQMFKTSRSLMKRYALALALAVSSLSVSSARASVIVYEGFNYTGQSDNTALGAAFNGGTGLSGNWSGSGKYRTSGLSFSDLAVVGGCAEGSNSQIYYRPLNVNKTGTIWGSFLFKSVGVVDTTTTLSSYIVNSVAGGNDWQATTKFGVTPKRYQGTTGDIRLGGNTGNPTALSNAGGTAVTQNETYLILFKVENLVASGGAATSQTITSWILSAAQYDNFKSGGLTEAELNAAAQGSGAANVMQRTTLTATQKASFLVTDYLTVQSNNAGDYMHDELRFSNTSINEAVVGIVTPMAEIEAFGPGAVIGPVVANAAAISWTVPYGTSVTSLAPTFTMSPGATCDKASGSTQDFTSPVNYSVTSSDYLLTTDYTVTVTVAPDESTLIWNVAGSGAWDLASANWKGQSSGLAMPFFNEKNVIFDKTAGGTITIASGVLPSNTTVSATSGTYTFNGSFGGTGMLTKSNNGTLNLGSANTYTGGTLISAGTVSCSLSDPSPLGGAGFVNVTVQSGATLAMNRNKITGSLTLNGGKIATGNGWGDDQWNGPVALSGTSTIDVGGTDGSLALNGVVSGTGTLIKLGTSNRVMPLNATNTFSGNLTINQGTIALGAAGSINNVALISIAAGATFDVSAQSSYSFSISNSLSASGTATTAKLKGASSGTVSLGSQPVTLTYNGLNPALTVTQGTLVLNANPFTVNTGAPLAVGTYNIVTQTTGSITSSGIYPGVTGTAIGAGKVGSISVSGANVILTISVPTLTVAGFPSPQTAGVTGNVTVTAKDGAGNTATAYNGTVQFASTDGAAILPANYTFVPADNGVHTFSVTLKTVAGGTKSITASDTTTSSTDTQPGIIVTSAPAAMLTVSGFPNPIAAGVVDTVTVTAMDAFNNVATGYIGTVAITSTDGAAVLPSNYTFVGGDNGIKVFSVTLNTVSGPTVAITATDTVTGTITGSQSGITVLPDTSAATLSVTGFPSPQTAGAAGDVTITAKKSNGDTATSYTGTIHFTSTDGAAILPSDYTFVAEDNGVHTFTSGVTLKTAGTRSITATDNATFITGSQSGINVTPAAATTLAVTGYPSPQYVGTAGSITVTAKDAYNNTVTGYTGTVAFSSTDGAATLPANYTFVGGDNGVHAFSSGVIFATAGIQSVTATDTVTGTITGTQSGITINWVPSIFSWVNTSGGFWDVAGNWTNNACITYVPDATGATNYVLTFDQAGTYTVNHNLNNGFMLNQMNFSNPVLTLDGYNLTWVNNGEVLPQLNQNSASEVTLNNNMALNSTVTVGGSGNGNVILAETLSGTGGLIKNTPGYLQLRGRVDVGVNTYTGPTVINSGTLHLGYYSGVTYDCQAGASPITMNSGTTLLFERIAATNALTLNGCTLYASNGWGVNWNGPVTVNSNSVITITSTGYINFNGIVSGAGGLTKTDAGPMYLNAMNIFSGTTTLNQGTIQIGASGQLASLQVVVNAGTLKLSNSSSLAETTTLRIADGGAKIDIPAGVTQTVTALYLGADGKPEWIGTWGHSSSDATNKDDVHFTATSGKLKVLTGLQRGMIISFY